MSDTQHTIPIPDDPAIYEIRLKGHLPERWIKWFGDVAIELEEGGVTRLTCPAMDQAALHGLLKKVRSLGAPLLSINRIETAPTGGTAEAQQLLARHSGMCGVDG